MGDVCSICKGEGKRIVFIKERMKTITEWCICFKSKYISQMYSMLEPLRGNYLPFDKIDSKLVFKPNELSKSPNIFIVDTDLTTFLLNIKSVIIKYRFTNNPSSIYLCKSIEILKKFYVQQNDGTSPSLSDLDKYDLVIFTLDTKEKNDQLKTCVTQVVYNRLCITKPTWVYLPKSTPLETTREYTEELKSFLDPIPGKEVKKFFIKKSLAGTEVKVKATRTMNQSRAEGFSI